MPALERVVEHRSADKTHSRSCGFTPSRCASTTSRSSVCGGGRFACAQSPPQRPAPCLHRRTRVRIVDMSVRTAYLTQIARSRTGHASTTPRCRSGRIDDAIPNIEMDCSSRRSSRRHSHRCRCRAWPACDGAVDGVDASAGATGTHRYSRQFNTRRETTRGRHPWSHQCRRTDPCIR